MLVDQDFQSSLSGIHLGGPIPNVPHSGDGPDIGPSAPTLPYQPVVLPNGAFYSPIESAPANFPTVMSYFNRPVLETPSGSGTLVLEFDLYVSPEWVTDGNAVETDTMLVTLGQNPSQNVRRNFSMQNVKGQLYVAQKGVWVPIPEALYVLTPGKLHHHKIMYLYTPSGGRFCTVQINGSVFSVPTAIQTPDVALVNWTPFATMQMQQSLIPSGKGFGAILDHASYTWGV